MKNAVLFIITFLLTSCHHNRISNKDNSENIIDSSFQFTIKETNDYIDSKTGSFTRQYYGITKTIHFGLTLEEMNKIRKVYFENRLDSLPDYYYPQCKPDVTPSFDDEFIIMFHGKQKRFIYNPDFYCQDSISQSVVKNMESFRNIIHELLYNKKAIKELEISDIEYM